MIKQTEGNVYKTGVRPAMVCSLETATLSKGKGAEPEEAEQKDAEIFIGSDRDGQDEK